MKKKRFRNSKNDNLSCAIIKFERFNVICNLDIDITNEKFRFEIKNFYANNLYNKFISKNYFQITHKLSSKNLRLTNN